MIHDEQSNFLSEQFKTDSQGDLLTIASLHEVYQSKIGKKSTKKYQTSTDNPMNWEYIEDTNQFIKSDGVVYFFKNYSSRTDKYGFQHDFKIYKVDKVDKVQDTPELEQLTKADSGNKKQIHYNPTWNYFKDLLKQTLLSNDGSQIYAKRKIDVEPVFGRLKSVFDVRRIHVRGKQVVLTEIGFKTSTIQNHTVFLST